MTADNMNGKLDQFAAMLDHYESSGNDRKELSTMRKALLEELNEVRFVDESQKESVWSRYRQLAAVYHQKMEQTNLEQQSFADEVARRIDEFMKALDKLAASSTPDRESFTALRQQADALFNLIKQPNWPNKELRTKTWEQFSALRETLRTKEDAFYEKLKAERDEKAMRSGEIVNALSEASKCCIPSLTADKAAGALQQLLVKLKGMNLPVEGVDIPSTDEALKNPLKTQSEALKEIRKIANNYKENFTWEDRQSFYALIDELKKEQDAAWDVYKQEAQRKKEERELKKQEWLTKQNDFLRMLCEKLEKQKQYRDKLEKFGNGQQEFILRLESRLSNQQDFLLKLHDDVDELQKQYDTAWSSTAVSMPFLTCL